MTASPELSTISGTAVATGPAGRALAQPMDAALVDALEGQDKVRFYCQSKPHALAWLALTPSVPDKTLIPTVEFRGLVRWTLGMGLHGVGEEAKCPKCGTTLDKAGHHLVCCH
jgi:hypothetical protein